MRVLIVVCMMMATWLNAGEKPEITTVFEAKKETVNGHKDVPFYRYREQNIIVTNSGKVVCIVQGRNKSGWCDRSGQDLLCKISEDSGKTWSKDIMMVSHGALSICPNAAVYDRDTNTIHVLYNLFTWPYNNRPKKIRGELGQQKCKQFVVTSKDEGKTWSKPREISDMADVKGATAIFGSGEGIQLKVGKNKGRLLVPGGDFYKGKKVLCYYSDDHGKTWKRSKTVPTPKDMRIASETKVAELPDGTIVLNSRSGGKRHRSFSKDGGLTWCEMEVDKQLKTIHCNAALITYPCDKAAQKTALLFSAPAGPKRSHGTVYISYDGGKNWPKKTLVAPGKFAYSSLMILPDGKIGLFYEGKGYHTIELAKFSFKWLTDNAIDNK